MITGVAVLSMCLNTGFAGLNNTGQNPISALLLAFHTILALQYETMAVQATGMGHVIAQVMALLSLQLPAVSLGERAADAQVICKLDAVCVGNCKHMCMGCLLSH